jgi:thiamine biosynthesis lipoprotein
VRFACSGVELNFGAIGKGHALDRAGRLLQRGGVRHALLSAGRSSVLALGGRDGGFLIDLVSPQARSRLARLRLENAALGTSGAGVQFAEVGGRRYGHVLDPRTGRPCSGVLSASVVAGDAATADGLSTAFLVGGLELAQRYCAAHENVLALITLDDGSERPCRVGGHDGAFVEES